MIKNLLIIIFLTTSNLTLGQNINKTELMGEWEALSVEIPDQVPEKEAVNFMKDAFTGAIFHFQGNGIFNIRYGKNADERIKDLFNPSGENWRIENGVIKLGNNDDGFSSMHIRYQSINEIIYFVMPMMRLNVRKIKSEKAEPYEEVSSKYDNTLIENSQSSELKIVEISESDIVPFKVAENPPLAVDCKSKWKVQKQRECTASFIQKHLQRKFNTELAGDIEITGRIRIEINFIIDKNGEAVNITATGGPELMNQNAVDVIATLPNLSPATHNGETVNVSYFLPLLFLIEE
jgi:hypothetical protein